MMEPNRILRLADKWCGSYDKMHYIGRVYSTAEILAEVLDPEEENKRYKPDGKRKLTTLVPDYTLAKNKKLLDKL